MLKITSITINNNINRKISQESLKSILKNADILKDYTTKSNLYDVINYIIEEWEQELLIGSFDDINDYIEWFLESIKEIY